MQLYVLAAGLVLVQTTLIAGMFLQRSRRRRAEEQLHKSQAELRTSVERVRDLGSRLLGAQEAERSRVARELHDDICQQLVVLSIDLELLCGLFTEQGRCPLLREALDRAQRIAKSVHDLSYRLHPAKLQLIGLETAINSLQRDFSQPNLRIAFSHHNVPSPLPHDLTVCLFRIAQEALANAVRHSDARDVRVRLCGSPDRIQLAVIDDGTGLDVHDAWGKGLGLISMRERAESVGGTLRICSAPGAGTRVEVSVPVRDVLQPAAV